MAINSWNLGVMQATKKVATLTSNNIKAKNAKVCFI